MSTESNEKPKTMKAAQGKDYGDIDETIFVEDNVNDFTNVAFQTGKIKKPDHEQVMKKTLSEAINIQLPYNLERVF